MSKGIQFLFTCLCLCVVGGKDASHVSRWGLAFLFEDIKAEVSKRLILDISIDYTAR
jgi:hypothetical protein